MLRGGPPSTIADGANAYEIDFVCISNISALSPVGITVSAGRGTDDMGLHIQGVPKNGGHRLMTIILSNLKYCQICQFSLEDSLVKLQLG